MKFVRFLFLIFGSCYSRIGNHPLTFLRFYAKTAMPRPRQNLGSFISPSQPLKIHKSNVYYHNRHLRNRIVLGTCRLSKLSLSEKPNCWNALDVFKLIYINMAMIILWA